MSARGLLIIGALSAIGWCIIGIGVGIGMEIVKTFIN
jgi:hypothetical protein